MESSQLVLTGHCVEDACCNMGVVKIAIDAVPVIRVVLYTIEIHYQRCDRKIVAIKGKQGDHVACVIIIAFDCPQSYASQEKRSWHSIRYFAPRSGSVLR